MDLNISAHHIEVTPGIRSYVKNKMKRVSRHIEHDIDVDIILSVSRNEQRAEAKLHLYGKRLFCEATRLDLYDAIDDLVMKVDRSVIKEKDRLTHHSAESIRRLQMVVGPV